MKRGLCTGPSHSEPTYLPLDSEHWYFHKSGVSTGKPVTPCRACANWKKLIKKEGPHGLVPLTSIRLHLAELVDRVGSIEGTADNYKIGANVIRSILREQQARVQKRTAQRVLLALVEQRKHDRQNGATNERYRARRVREAARDKKMTASYG